MLNIIFFLKHNHVFQFVLQIKKGSSKYFLYALLCFVCKTLNLPHMTNYVLKFM